MEEVACGVFAGQSFEYAEQAGQLLSGIVSATALGQHCDDALLPEGARAQSNGLNCVRNECRAHTICAPAAAAADQLEPRHLEVLKKPIIRVVGPPGVKVGGREVRSEPRFPRTDAGRPWDLISTNGCTSKKTAGGWWRRLR